jgi:hypothetical protein
VAPRRPRGELIERYLRALDAELAVYSRAGARLELNLNTGARMEPRQTLLDAALARRRGEPAALDSGAVSRLLGRAGAALG